MEFISVKNGIITGRHSGKPEDFPPSSSFFGSDFVEVPTASNAQGGDPVNFYDTSWKRKSDKQLVKEKLLQVPSGWKLDGEKLVEMTREEKIIAGVLPTEAGQKIVNGEIVAKSIDEKLADGEIKKADYDEAKKNETLGKKQELISWAMSDEIKAKCFLDSDFEAKIKAFLLEVMAIEKQEGFPLNVVFPAKPE